MSDHPDQEEAMTRETTIDLHGHEKQPFPNFGEDATYLERVTLDRDHAVELLRGYGCDWGGAEPELEEIFMRWGLPENDEQRACWYEPDGPCWWECGLDHPDAVPFWKDSE